MVQETQRGEIKRDINWDVKIFARSILALSNVRDGGFIIIGVEDNFNRLGVNETIIESYKIDEMRDQLSKFADPKVNFDLITIEDYQKNKYVVIRVYEFVELPVICKRTDQNANLQEGIIYYRNTNRRIQSAPISNSNDLRELIELTAIKKFSKWKNLGLNLGSNDIDKLNEELEGL